jgi:hypothetical protein
MALSPFRSFGSRAGALATAGVVSAFALAAPATAQQVANIQQGCGLMSAQQRSDAMRLVLSVSDDIDVSGPYLQQVVACIKGTAASRPVPVTPADRQAQGQLNVLFIAKGMPAL